MIGGSHNGGPHMSSHVRTPAQIFHFGLALWQVDREEPYIARMAGMVDFGKAEEVAKRFRL